MSQFDKVISVDEWKYEIEKDPVYFDSIVNLMDRLGLFQDESEPGHQVIQLYEAGEDLDKYLG